jgi:ribosomal protein S18 acetylase RimI-like enzyme
MSMTTINIRTCIAGDEQALALVGQATFLETFAGIINGGDILSHCTHQHSTSVYRDWLEKENVRTWIAEAEPGNAPVGYLVLTPPNLPVADLRNDDFEIKRIYLLHRFQGAGLGKRLMNEAETFAHSRGCRRLLLGVYSLNAQAIAFYEGYGFKRIGTRDFKVGDNLYHDIVLALDL